MGASANEFKALLARPDLGPLRGLVGNHDSGLGALRVRLRVRLVHYQQLDDNNIYLYIHKNQRNTNMDL